MERETGVEPATSSLGSLRSTPELLPLPDEKCKSREFFLLKVIIKIIELSLTVNGKK